MSIGIELDIGGTIVGAITLIVLAWQIHGQSSFSKRIADLEYIKLIEPRLLAILYRVMKNNQFDPNENSESVPSFDYYKFIFYMGGLVVAQSETISFDSKPVYGSRSFIRIYILGKLNKDYENAVKCIKTKDIKNTFVDSEFGEVFRVIKNSFNEKAS